MGKQESLNKICEVIRYLTKGDANPLREIRHIIYNGNEYAVPVFEDGAGEPNQYYPEGYYAVNITANSELWNLVAIVESFVKRVW